MEYKGYTEINRQNYIFAGKDHSRLVLFSDFSN